MYRKNAHLWSTITANLLGICTTNCAAKTGILFFSPTSMSAALDMTRLGAAGDTLTQMAHVLGDSQDEATHHQEQGSLLQELDDSDTCSVTLSIANQVFAQTGLSLNPTSKQHWTSTMAHPQKPSTFKPIRNSLVNRSTNGSQTIPKTRFPNCFQKAPFTISLPWYWPMPSI